MSVTLHQLLKTMVERGGSDLHITTNSPPQIRIDGKLTPLDMPPLTAPETKQLAYSVLTDAQKHRFEENLELDISFGIKAWRASAPTSSTSAAPPPPSIARFRTRSSDSGSSVSRRWWRRSATGRAAWCSSPVPPVRANRRLSPR